MGVWVGVFVAGLMALLAAALLRQGADRWMNRRARQSLIDAPLPPDWPERFDPAMVAHLPEPVQRYFRFMLAPGAPLSPSVVLDMQGTLSLGDARDPKSQPMACHQVMRVPQGLVWELSAGRAPFSFSGADGMWGHRSWTRIWLAGVLPVARTGLNPDHLRASLGRVVVEGAIWVPAALLPHTGVRWSVQDAHTIRAAFTHLGMEQAVDIRLDADGRPLWVRTQRWSDANPQKVFQLQPFGGFVSDFRSVQGIQMAFQVEAGNHFMLDDYFPFFRARITQARPVWPGDPD